MIFKICSNKKKEEIRQKRKFCSNKNHFVTIFLKLLDHKIPKITFILKNMQPFQ